MMKLQKSEKIEGDKYSQEKVEAKRGQARARARASARNNNGASVETVATRRFATRDSPSPPADSRARHAAATPLFPTSPGPVTLVCRACRTAFSICVYTLRFNCPFVTLWNIYVYAFAACLAGYSFIFRVSKYHVE